MVDFSQRPALSFVHFSHLTPYLAQEIRELDVMRRPTDAVRREQRREEVPNSKISCQTNSEPGSEAKFDYYICVMNHHFYTQAWDTRVEEQPKSRPSRPLPAASARPGKPPRAKTRLVVVLLYLLPMCVYASMLLCLMHSFKFVF
jgi:hypothetical protein